MCITQSRRRRSYGLNLAAYTAAYAKEAPERTAGQTTTNGASYVYTTSAASTRPIEGAIPATAQQQQQQQQQQGEQFVDPRDGTAFTAVAFPDADADAAFDVLDVDVPPAVQQQQPGAAVSDFGETTTTTTTTTPSSSVVAASSRGEEFHPLEGQYVQGVYIPPSKPAPKRTRKPQKAGLTAKRNVRHFIQHNYHDHSDEVPTEADVSAEPTAEQVEEAIRLHNMTGGKSKGGGGGGGGGVKATLASASSGANGNGNGNGSIKISFPRKLHHILDQIERDGYAHVISWLPHGRAFAIHKPKDFIATVMPHYFQQSKITSFQRQLNLYGFQRLTRGRDNGGYYHEYFLRGMPFLTKNITRTRVKGTRFKGASNPEAEPNFYGMRPVGLGGVHQRQQVQVQAQVQVHQAPAPIMPVAPAPAPMPMPMPRMPVALTRRVSDGSDTSSLSCPSAHNNNHQQGYCTLQRANPIGGQYEYMASHQEVPRQVVVPASQHNGHSSHNANPNPTQYQQYEQYRQISSAAIAAAAAASAKKMAASACASPTPTSTTAGMAAYAHYQAKMSSVVPSPITTSASQQQQPPKKPASICDLWEDQPDAFEPNPFVPSPPASPARQQGVAPASTGAAAGAANGADPLLDLVESWAHDDTMDDLVEQAIENDVDFGHLLDMIAQE